MIDKFNDFYKELRDRTSNPLISSFIISWIVFNWDIVVVLFFYRITDLKTDGYSSFLNYIIENSSLEKSLLFPIAGSLFFTFIFPFIKNCILAFNTWIRSWGTTWSLEISKAGKISMERYLELRKKYTEKQETLQDLIEKQSEFVTARENTYEENQILQKALNEKQNELTNFKNMCSITSIIGYWIMKRQIIDNHTIEYNVEINHTNILEQKKDSSNILIYKILGYFINVQNNQIILFIQLDNETKKYIILQYNSDFTNLEGSIDNQRIQFIKI